MNTKKNEEYILNIVRNVAFVNSTGIPDLFASFRMDDEDMSVVIGRKSNSSENDRVITSCPDFELSEYVAHLCERWVDKMRAESQSEDGNRAKDEALTEEGGEA